MAKFDMDIYKSSIVQELSDYITSLAKESERATCILSASRLDDSLGRLCQSVLSPSPTSEDHLFDPERPLSSFNARIHLAYRLGLISTHIAHALHIVRKIRNDFAHSIQTDSLSDPRYRNRISALEKDIITDNPLDQMQLARLAGLSDQYLISFCNSVCYLLVHIESECHFASLRILPPSCPYQFKIVDK